MIGIPGEERGNKIETISEEIMAKSNKSHQGIYLRSSTSHYKERTKNTRIYTIVKLLKTK